MVRNLQRWILLLCWCSFVAAAAPPGVWLDVPFVKQERNGCGAASIAMVMQYWQRQQGKAPESGSDVGRIQRALYSPEAHGIHASNLEGYLEGHGFRTFAFGGQWEDLKQHLEKGRPLIVALRSGRDDFHYVVVTGLDQDVVMKHDPAERRLLKQHRADFEREWKASGAWTLLALPDQ